MQAALHCTTQPHLFLLLPQEEAPALVLQGLAAKMGPTFVKLAQTLRWGMGWCTEPLNHSASNRTN